MDFELIEKTIERLSSVISCKFIVNEDSIEEIHIVSNGLRSPKQLVRDIQSILVATHGIQLDHKKVSIAEILDERLKRSYNRLIIRSVSVESLGNKANVRLVLESGDKTFERSQTGINSIRNIERMLIDMTLRMMEEAYDYEEAFVFDDIQVISLSDKKLVVIIVNHIDKGRERAYCGSGIVGNNQMETVVKATLDAVNRYTTL